MVDTHGYECICMVAWDWVNMGYYLVCMGLSWLDGHRVTEMLIHVHECYELEWHISKLVGYVA